MIVLDPLHRAQEKTILKMFLQEHDVECRRLVTKYPDMGSPIRGKLTEVQDKWLELVGLAGRRRAALEAAHSAHKFHAQLRELHSWVQDTIDRMDSSEAPANIAQANQMLELHHERKVFYTA